MIESRFLHNSPFYPHTLTLTLTTESPINRAFQADCEGVRVEKEKKFFIKIFRELRLHHHNIIIN